MEQQQILNATITIEQVVDKEKKLSIKANDGHRSYTFSVFKNKQDGSPTAAYAQYANMGLGVGSTVMVGYVIDEYTTNIGGFDKRIQSKKIINFREAATQLASAGKTSPGEAPTRLQGPLNDTFGRRLALHGFVNGMLANGVMVETIIKDLPALLRLEDEIDKVLGATAKSVANLGLPVIDQSDDLSSDVSDIPF